MPTVSEPAGRTVAVIQSNYIPWKGYFDIIHGADLFIFYDEVQYTTNDWRNRNRIKTRDGAAWLSIPVASRHGQAISEVTTSDARWQVKHWKTLCQYYSRAPHFNRYREFFESFYLGPHWDSLSGLNQHLIAAIARDCLGIRTELRDSSTFTLQGDRIERLLGVLRQAGATTYLSGPSARGYIDEDAFADAGIELVYKDYHGFPEYPQFHPPFEHHVSILDLLFQAGSDAPEYIWGWRETGAADARA